VTRAEDVRRIIEEATEHPDPRRAEQMARNRKIGDDNFESPFAEIMTLEEMHDRLYYVGSSGAVADRVTGRIRKRELAPQEYAASQHPQENGKSQPCLKLWLSSPRRRTVDVLTWRPGSPQICPPPEPNGSEIGFNTWQGLVPVREPPADWQERVRPFQEHVAYLVPIESERIRFLQWLAHIFQSPGELPHTAYLMTTPTTGIGRNLLASIIVRALRGHVAAGVSLPEILDGGFTGRLSQKLLAIVDEVREGNGAKRYQRTERLKSLITETHRHINVKYGHQTIEQNCCRWLMFSNHVDAIPFDSSDRRIIVIENPKVRKKAEYYETLFRLLDDDLFVASVRKYLETLDISGFRAGDHAPLNAAKDRALASMMSETEHAVLDFKEQCRTELTTRSDIRNYVKWNTTTNDGHLTHAIERAGMINTGRRIKDLEGKKQSVVIVKGPWTIESVRKTSSEVILEALAADRQDRQDTRSL
jgi:hypothetical protein